MTSAALKYSSDRLDDESWRCSIPMKRRGRWSLLHHGDCREERDERDGEDYEASDKNHPSAHGFRYTPSTITDLPWEQSCRGAVGGNRVVVLALIGKRVGEGYPSRSKSTIDQIGLTAA